MGDVINLRRARKARQRLSREQVAAQARAFHGRSKAERATTLAEVDRLARQIEQSRREPAPPESPSIRGISELDSAG